MQTINWHLGLGDAIICAPIAIKYLNPGYVMSTQGNFISVDSIFQGTDVGVHVVKDKFPVDGAALNLGHYGIPREEGESFDRWFFRQAGMDITDRSLCPITNGAWKETEQHRIEARDFIFLHEDSERGFFVNRDKLPMKVIVTPYAKMESILAYSELIINAKEVHVIDSVFLHLADRLPCKGKLFWHRYARANEDTKGLYLKQNWTIYED